MEDKFLTIKEASRLTKLSVSLINKLVNERKIPSLKVGKRRLFDRDELIAWMKSQKDT
jgi:excisionase family DNA binding protein